MRWKQVLKHFGKEYNVDIEIYETDSPGDTISQKYAAGDAPTIAIWILQMSEILQVIKY